MTAETETEAGTALYQFVGAFVDELARSGCRDVCQSPGSRSTPLALLCREHPAISLWTHLDERSSAFFALGMAKASRRPVAVVCTSGTAATNFAPAVVEAYMAGVPLILLTADRPPELRDVGAPQTIDQLRLYGTYAKWFVDMMLPEATEDAIRYARTVACRATSIASSGRGGPVHLNFPFREPLIPPDGSGPPSLGRRAAQATDRAEPPNGAPYISITEGTSQPDAGLVASLANRIRAAERGVIICGPQDEPDFPAAAIALAQAAGFPILADPLSQIRCGSHHGPLVLDSYDAFLRNEAVVEELQPDIVLRLGATPVSKALMLYLKRHAGAHQVLVSASEAWNDPLLIASEAIEAEPSALCSALSEALGQCRDGDAVSDGSWPARWQEIDGRTREAVRAHLASRTDLSEPQAVALLTELLPPGALLFAGNSMPIRDLDTMLTGGVRPIRVLGNRGASGIDGVISTALGASAACSEPVVLLIGDVSFYHDMNGLLAANRHGLRATIVLLNNDGGGIFSFLPQAKEAEHFEELFGTPHGLDFSHAAAMYGVGYRVVASDQEFRAAVGASLDSEGVDVIEVRTDRKANAELHTEIWDAVSRELDKRA